MEKLTKKERKELAKLERIEEEKNLQNKNLIRKLLMWGSIASIVFLSISGLVKLTNNDSSVLSSIQTNLPPVTKEDLAFGDKKSKITLIEYSDFQCPACAIANAYIQQALSDYDGKILFVYRFFPLIQIHKNSLISAQAAYAAHLQGKFLEMEDLLFENQNSWGEVDNAKEIFLSYAQKIGLNLEQFTKDLEAEKTKTFINKQAEEGINLGINETPTIFLNGKKINNQRIYEKFKQLIEAELTNNP